MLICSFKHFYAFLIFIICSEIFFVIYIFVKGDLDISTDINTHTYIYGRLLRTTGWERVRPQGKEDMPITAELNSIWRHPHLKKLDLATSTFKTLVVYKCSI